ncbi:hypothetical protein SASPL_136504 [Salvia splendens]|uniref:Uncharacterized protein n=1 Tax=Salvia splendens TaxID=180675 RepID=A0A8X8WZX8_SALSN|nr:hypothetical protein SASPL_136504 [Salvia splendens]
MPERDKVSYASMISIYLKNDEYHKAEGLYFEIPEGMRSIVADSAMVDAYAKAGEVDDAVQLFGRMPDREKNVVTWTTVITGFARNGLIEEARDAFDRMPLKNVVVWTSMIKAYVEIDRVDEAFSLFCVMPEQNLYAWSIMISGLLNVNRVDEAKELFDSIPWRNAISWTTMVTGLARNGMTELARKYFDQMLNKDTAAWNAMITAYAEEGRMESCQPVAMLHYSCLVDILGRAGLVKEAVKVVDEMPPDKCDSVVLQSLIGGCRLLGADGVADHIDDELIELDPACSGGYVLLANLYAATGKWDKFAQLRKKMKEREVRKVPGFSQIEVNGKTHVFLVRDGAHSELKEIYKFLDEKLTPEVKDLGYEISILSAFSTQSDAL